MPGVWAFVVYVFFMRRSMACVFSALRSAKRFAPLRSAAKLRTRQAKQKSPIADSYQGFFFGTRSRDRTGTAIAGHRILSPACLPIPPSGRSLPREKATAKIRIIYELPKSIYRIISSSSVGANHRIPGSRRNHVSCRLAYRRVLRLMSSTASSRVTRPSKQSKNSR